MASTLGVSNWVFVYWWMFDQIVHEFMVAEPMNSMMKSLSPVAGSWIFIGGWVVHWSRIAGSVGGYRGTPLRSSKDPDVVKRCWSCS